MPGYNAHEEGIADADRKRSTDESRSSDERQAEEESKAPPVSKPGGFNNDPDDPTNPNEVRERHLRQLRRGDGACGSFAAKRSASCPTQLLSACATAG